FVARLHGRDDDRLVVRDAPGSASAVFRGDALMDKTGYFFILGMPGTDKPWLANFLTYARSICYVNPAAHFEAIDNLPKLFEISKKPFQGAADSLLTLFHVEIQEMFDAPPIVLIERDYKDVMGFANAGVGETIVTEAIRREMPKVKAYDNCLTVSYTELAQEAACKRI